VPSVRFSRDKRGYEYVYLVHTPVRRGKPGRTRVLYWYRTPPGIRIGRKPFDEEVQRTIERQNPGLTFDWDAIINTPMPPPDMTEYWRERRRAEKAARQERRALEAEETTVEQAQTPPAAPIDEEAFLAENGSDTQQEVEPEIPRQSRVDQDVMSAVEAARATEAADSQGARRRRRRRGGRRRRPATGEVTDQTTASVEPGSANAAAGDIEPGDEAGSDEQSEDADSTSEEE
jgi:ribonuclease E